MYNSTEKEWESLRKREILDHRYLPVGLINAYLDERMKANDKKKFETLVGDIEGLKQLIQRKKQENDFINEFIPDPKINAQGIRKLRGEMKEINDTVLGEDKTSFTRKIADILDTTIIEF